MQQKYLNKVQFPFGGYIVWKGRLTLVYNLAHESLKYRHCAPLEGLS